MRYLVGGLLAMSLVFGTARWASAGCDLTDPTTAAQVAAARAAADQACDQKTPPAGCTTASSHGQYVSCVAHEANANTSLPKECRGAVKRCAARSVCGKQAKGFVTCCKTSSSGATKCSTKSSTTACTDHAPAGGSACVGSHASCCDACTDTGCAP